MSTETLGYPEMASRAQIAILDQLVGQINRGGAPEGENHLDELRFVGRLDERPPEVITGQWPPEHPVGEAEDGPPSAAPPTTDIRTSRLPDTERKKLTDEYFTGADPELVSELDIQRQQWVFDGSNSGNHKWHASYRIFQGPTDYDGQPRLDIRKRVVRNDDLGSSDPKDRVTEKLTEDEQAYVQLDVEVSAAEMAEVIDYAAGIATARTATIPDTIPATFL